ncbi:MAG: hypothetical protein ACI82H_001254, partial [Alphaproteobacteria bacterium]
ENRKKWRKTATYPRKGANSYSGTVIQASQRPPGNSNI